MTLSAGPAAIGDLDAARTTSISPLISPALLREDHPVDAAVAKVVRQGRAETADILEGRDDRLLVVVGPCSVHDPEAALDYARPLAAKAEELRGELPVVMPVYFEKPRPRLGWRGLVNDPD